VPRQIFVTGPTGYLGRHVIPMLLDRGHMVRGLVRRGSEQNLPAGCDPIVGDALDRSTFAHTIGPADTFLQLVGVPHPSPAKAQQFLDIDLRSAVESIKAARAARVAHFVYISVAQPAPVMRAYQAARKEAERTLRESGLRHTILRPFYVLGPGHYWPYLLVPAYWALERWPSTRATAQRLGLVTVRQMASAIVDAIEHPANRSRIVQVPEIRLTPTAPNPRHERAAAPLEHL
jgi:uncharacterized protein YbjT (DUF2867 family)